MKNINLSTINSEDNLFTMPGFNSLIKQKKITFNFKYFKKRVNLYAPFDNNMKNSRKK